MKSYTNNAVLQASLEGRLAGQRTLSLFHYQCRDMVNARDWEDDLAEFHSAFYTDAASVAKRFIACCSQDYALVSVRYQLITPIRYSWDGFLTPAVVGLIAQPSLPPNDSAVITKRTDFAGPHEHGSLHVPAVPQDAVVNGILTATHIAVLADLRTKMVESIITPALPDPATVWDPVLFNRVAPTASKRITNGFVQSTSRVVRRRTVGVGE